jgi:hypothetical protein
MASAIPNTALQRDFFIVVVIKRIASQASRRTQRLADSGQSLMQDTEISDRKTRTGAQGTGECGNAIGDALERRILWSTVVGSSAKSPRPTSDRSLVSFLVSRRDVRHWMLFESRIAGAGTITVDSFRVLADGADHRGSEACELFVLTGLELVLTFKAQGIFAFNTTFFYYDVDECRKDPQRLSVSSQFMTTKLFGND